VACCARLELALVRPTTAGSERAEKRISRRLVGFGPSSKPARRLYSWTSCANRELDRRLDVAIAATERLRFELAHVHGLAALGRPCVAPIASRRVTLRVNPHVAQVTNPSPGADDDSVALHGCRTRETRTNARQRKARARDDGVESARVLNSLDSTTIG
jgi:hypothetical protein